MSSRAARSAGKKPPRNPMARAKPTEFTAIAGDSEKENASSENDVKLSVEMVTNWSKDASPTPSPSPISASSSTSPMKSARIDQRSQQTARNVPESTVQL